MAEKKEEAELLIRCTPEVFKAWKIFLADRGIRTYSDGLRWLLKRAGYWELEFTLRLVGEKGTKLVRTKAPLGRKVKLVVAKE